LNVSNAHSLSELVIEHLEAFRRNRDVAKESPYIPGQEKIMIEIVINFRMLKTCFNEMQTEATNKANRDGQQSHRIKQMFIS
jgi:pyruvate formate-lyase activating enzyme-like uncharacterized protein